MQPAPVQRQDEIFCVVDRDDHVLGYRTRAECHADATLIHRSVSVVVETSEGMLFQRRSLRKDSSPGFWDVACSGHVDGEETYAEAAVRELGALADIPIDDEAMALRIAVGAGAAVMAVAAARAALQVAGALDDALLGGEPADHLATLESLAGDGSR